MASRYSDEEQAALKERVLAYVEQTGNGLNLAAGDAGIHPSTLWRWRQADTAFNSRLRQVDQEAREKRIDRVEDLLYAYVLKGLSGQLTFANGQPADINATVLIAWLKRNSSEYRDALAMNRIHHTGTVDLVTQRRRADAELEKFEKELLQQAGEIAIAQPDGE